MSAYDNLKLKCICVGLHRPGYIENILNIVGLGNVGKKKVGHFSLGMKQRLGMLIFLCAYLSNVAFSLYYNIKVLLQPFDKQKMINSGLKVATFVVGLTLLCVAITTLPIYADQLGWAIPEEYTEIFADLVIVGAVLMVSCKYIAEAFTKFKAILQVKGDTENE